MTVASKTPIQHQRHKTATKKSSLKSTLTAAFSRHASTTDALDEYTRSMRTYLEHSDDVDLQGRSSREPSPEFYWRDLNDIHIPNDALANPSSRHQSNASSFHPPPAEYSSSHTDTDEDPSSDTSSLSSRISAMHIGVASATGSTSGGAVVALTREQQAAAARQARVAQHQQQYNTNRVGGAGPAWHFYHAPVPKKKSSTPSMLRRNTSSSAVTSSSSSKKHCVK